MRLSTYRRPDGTVGHGRVVDDGARVEDLGDGDLLAVVSGDEPADGPSRASYAWDELTVLAPVLAPPKVLCVATNYQEHIVEGGGDRVDPTRVSPKLFMKPPTSVIGDGATYEIPEISAAADWEAELCVVIGTGGRASRRTGARPRLRVCGQQRHLAAQARRRLRPRRQRVGRVLRLAGGEVVRRRRPHRAVDPHRRRGARPAGPAGAADPQRRAEAGRIDGRHDPRLRQLVAFASRLFTLQPGDVILTGTPAGVGATTGTFLTDGDVMVADLGPVGRLTTYVTGRSTEA